MQSARPSFVLYVGWHPGFSDGYDLAKSLYKHFRRDLYRNVTGGVGVSVVYCTAMDPVTGLPGNVDLQAGDTVAVVLLIDSNWTGDSSWFEWAKSLLKGFSDAAPQAMVLPVAIDSSAYALSPAQQTVRWHDWQGLGPRERELRLKTALTHQFCRMLRQRHHQANGANANDLQNAYLEKVSLFLSHSKHDEFGEAIATAIREKLYRGSDVGSFFDVQDIPPGTSFSEVLLHQVRRCALVAIHTDSYSSREWCRREIIEAKSTNVPLVVTSCIKDRDDRAFPYLGNVPMVRMDPQQIDRIDDVVLCILDEVMKDLLWQNRIRVLVNADVVGTAFIPRTPELISLASILSREARDWVLVYPDPPIGTEEELLFNRIAPTVRLRSMNEWLAEVTS